MKAIINGRKYDTETAKEMAYAESDCGRNSFGWYEETLYKKRTGEFFLAGEGYAATKYATHYEGGTRGPGSKIIPLTYEEAEEWGERNLSADRYEEIFGEVSE